jgi:hypothetical protein
LTGETRTGGRVGTGAGAAARGGVERGGVGAVLLQPKRPMKNKLRQSSGRETRNIIEQKMREVEPGLVRVA